MLIFLFILDIVTANSYTVTIMMTSSFDYNQYPISLDKYNQYDTVTLCDPWYTVKYFMDQNSEQRKCNKHHDLMQ